MKDEEKGVDWHYGSGHNHDEEKGVDWHYGSNHDPDKAWGYYQSSFHMRDINYILDTPLKDIGIPSKLLNCYDTPTKKKHSLNCFDTPMKRCQDCKYCKIDDLYQNGFYCSSHKSLFNLKQDVCEHYKKDTISNIKAKATKSLGFPLKKLEINIDCCIHCPYHDPVHKMCDMFFKKVDIDEAFGFPDFCELEDITPLNMLNKEEE